MLKTLEYYIRSDLGRWYYMGIFSEEVGKVAIEKLTLKLMIFNPVLEEIVEWIH